VERISRNKIKIEKDATTCFKPLPVLFWWVLKIGM